MIVKLRDVRLAFPDLWEAKPFEPGAQPKFGAVFLFSKEHPAFKEVMDAIKAVATEAWKDKANDMLAAFKGNANKMCFLDGNLKSQLDGYAGNFALTAKSKVRVPVLNRDKSPLSEADGRIYGGCFVNAQVDLWAQTKKYPGIRSSLMGVQFVRDGDAFSGVGVASNEDFDDLSDGADAPPWAEGSSSGADFV